MKPDIMALRQEYRDRNANIQIEEANLEIFLKKLQEVCPHDFVAECDYRSSVFGGSEPPRRICEQCGIEEEGWGCGYKILTNKRIRSVTRDELFGMRDLDFDIVK